MKLELTDNAIQWFEDEFSLDNGKAIRFFGKTYGNTEVHEGFSVGLTVDELEGEALAKQEVNGITYFAGKEDDWFFSGYDLEIDFDFENEDLIYHFHETAK
ncbi:HesB/YadR/YfhF family protein [Marinilactibacillus sp. GCM10026970]|uniref:HesB/YadR/YfhF family protein n=1 Tax=unclassified Marinilactibacillus TaxID=2632303 RepID=UPI001CE3BA39|nr:iron-sulfur cluster biosynthesis protein [Marinilactibacillus sp. Marseille-P9653]